MPRDFALEQELITRFGLRDASVLETKRDADEAQPAGGDWASWRPCYLQRRDSDACAGLRPSAWPGARACMPPSTALPNNLGQRIDVVQFIGGRGALVVDSPDLARMVAASWADATHDLHAPVLVEKPEVREIFLNEPAVREGIHRAATVQLAITGIGTVDDNASSFLRAGLVTRTTWPRCATWAPSAKPVAASSTATAVPTASRSTSGSSASSWTTCATSPQVLAVARHSQGHLDLGALRGKFLTVLATDDMTARHAVTRRQLQPAKRASHKVVERIQATSRGPTRSPGRVRARCRAMSRGPVRSPGHCMPRCCARIGVLQPNQKGLNHYDLSRR